MDVNQTYEPEMPVEWICPNPDNPNEGDIAALEDSINENGWFGAVLVRQLGEFEYELLGGEHRWRAVVAKGLATIPAVVLHDVDDARALKIMLGDNEVTRRGAYNVEKLNKILTALPDIRGTGFPVDILEQLTAYEGKRAAGAVVRRDAVFPREYGIVIECPDEDVQEKIYNQLIDVGLDPNTLRTVSI